MTIYAMRVSDDQKDVAMVFDSLNGGEGRFGWSSVETADLRQLRNRITQSGWDSLNEDEQQCYQRQDFLLDLRSGDYVIYINVPDWGRCTLAEVTGEYEWRHEDHDFNHRYPVEPKSVYAFDRNADIVPAALSRRLKLQGRWWRVYVTEEFNSLLDSLRKGADSALRTPETNLKELSARILPLFVKMASDIQHTHPGKDLEPFFERVFKNVPEVKNVTRQEGRADHGADLLVELEYGSIPGLVQTKTLVVQVKSYGGQHSDTSAVDDLRRAFEYHSSADMGLIVSTAESAGEDMERALEKLQEESGKPVSLLIGADLAAFSLRYGGGLLR